MKIKFVPKNSREARLANVRLVLVKDTSSRAPDENMDLIFHRGHGEVWGFKLRETYGYETEVFTADRAKVEAESKACGHKTEAEKRAWLEGIKDAEQKVWQAWMDGEVYGIVIERYDESDRNFFCVAGQYEIYGWENVVECLKDMDLTEVEVFCVDPECGDPNRWKDQYRELNI